MTGLDRSIGFIKGTGSDHAPFHPIIMRWAAKYAGVRYRDFCTVPQAKCHAMIKCARDFNIDWVTVMSDPWAEASAFGVIVEYPEDSLPIDRSGHIPDARTASHLKKYDPLRNERCRSRLAEIELYRKQCGEEFFVVGWVEGAVAEYVDLRGASNASVDFFTDPVSVEKALDIITGCAMDFISLQIAAGAHCIGIGDAFCSQIGPELYGHFGFPREKTLVDHIHSLGALAKLHICGDTSSILTSMIRTGADIIDIDHLVPSLKDFTPYLEPHQVFSGKSDPVTVVQEGSPVAITENANRDFEDAEGRCIVSAGCEITPETIVANMKAFSESAHALYSM